MNNSAHETSPHLRRRDQRQHQQGLTGLLGKSVSECKALCIPTALYGHPHGAPEGVWRFIAGKSNKMSDLGWKSVGVLDLTALPSIDKSRWTKWVEETDAFLVEGGDAIYLAFWLRKSGLAQMLPSLLKKSVWAGLSAGSMAMTPRVGEAFVETKPSITGDDKGLGLVNFSIFPHLDYPGFDENTMVHAEEWAAEIGGPSYAIDDETAIKVDGEKVDVVSEGKWRYFPG
jgi:dipeptidase E